MQIYLDLVAVATSLVAIWYTMRESRRSNCVVLKIKHCTASLTQAIDECGGQCFDDLKLVIQNNGIALHHVHAAIEFRGSNGYGWLSLPLRRRKRSGDRDEFAKGMIVEFGLKSYELNETDLTFIKLLRDPKKQGATIGIYSQDYLAATFRIGGYWDRVRCRWNKWAFRFNNLFTHKIGNDKEGPDVIRTYDILPMLTTLAPRVLEFVRSTEKGSVADQGMHPVGQASGLPEAGPLGVVLSHRSP